MGEKKKKKKKKKKLHKKTVEHGDPRRHGSGLLTPPYNRVGPSPRAPPVARSVHWYRSSLPRRLAARRLRMGYLRTIRHTGGPNSQPRAGTHSRPLGNDGRTRVPPPRAPVHLRRDASGRTSLVQSRGADLLRRRPGLPRYPIAHPRAVNPGHPRLPSPPHGTLRRVPPRRRAPRRSRARLPLPRAVLRPSRVLRRSGHPSRASDQRTEERTSRHARHARHVRPSSRHRERTRLELARTPRRPVIGERVRLRDEVRADAPRKAVAAGLRSSPPSAPCRPPRRPVAASRPSVSPPRRMPGLATPDARRL